MDLDLPDAPFRYADRHQHGLASHQVTRLVAEGVLRRPLRGVLCRADVPDDPYQRALAARLVLPPDRVVCDASAGWLHGVSAAGMPDRLDVASPPGRDASVAEGLYGCSRTLLGEDVMTWHGLLITTPLRTAADLACRWGRLEAMAVLDEYRRRHELTPADYAAITTRFAGRRGVTQLRELAPKAITLAESPPESWTRLAIMDAGLPEPEAQPSIYLDGYGWVRPDLAYRRRRIAIEYDGVEHHTSEEDREHDRVRRRAMDGADWVIVVVRKNGFAEPVRSRWLDELRVAFRERTEQRRRYARGEPSYTIRTRRRA